DVPSGQTWPRLGLTSDARLPKSVGGPAGLGVDPVTGGFGGSVTDLSVPGVAGPLSFSRAYDSVAIPGFAGTPLGPKWSHNWQAYVSSLAFFVNNTFEQFMVLNTPGGGSYTFQVSGSNYIAPPGVDATLTGSFSTGWTLTTEAQV